MSKFASNIKAKNRDEVRGRVLFQLIENKKLKVEFSQIKKVHKLMDLPILSSLNVKLHKR
ncbi:hypothetical protein CMO93_02260 [Candidatus Woesearchaeota archaeon]|nr:hypothetical protein [Candidatus Woesearchaeota archaeon]|tara:strand:- start:7519 stop:7698 length:180 start_codon:yes stop_codon:yes gene_type:complete